MFTLALHYFNLGKGLSLVTLSHDHITDMFSVSLDKQGCSKSVTVEFSSLEDAKAEYKRLLDEQSALSDGKTLVSDDFSYATWVEPYFKLFRTPSESLKASFMGTKLDRPSSANLGAVQIAEYIFSTAIEPEECYMEQVARLYEQNGNTAHAERVRHPQKQRAPHNALAECVMF